jgi:dTDP-4-amino-4,6-dideoxygalactose transaminase
VSVPLFDAAREFAQHAEELEAAALEVLRSGRYILGPEVKALEDEVAESVGTAHGIGVASGTDALIVALRAVGVAPGDRVLTTPFTFFATVSAILSVGAQPVLADIEDATLTLDPEAVRTALESGPPVKAMIPVHLFGQTADMAALEKLAADHGVAVVEDVAQAQGAAFGDRAAGSLGAMGCFSFFPTKNLGGFGDGGMITTDDADLAAQARLVRAHGSQQKYRHEVVGTNSRLDALQAAMLRVRLRHLPELTAARQRVASRYDEALAAIDGLRPIVAGADRTHVYHQYTVWVDGDRDAFRARLSDRGVETAVYYPAPVHLQPALAGQFRAGEFPVAEAAAQHVVSLPMFPTITDAEVDEVIAAL